MIVTVVGTGECHVWWADPEDRPTESLMAVLSDRELERAARFRRDADRRRFLTGSWLLRTTCAAQLGIRPEDVVVDRACPDCDRYHGKPQIRAELPLHCSVSHSGERVVVALTTEGPVGVDVEAVPATPVEELARGALTPRERAALEAFPPAGRYEAFTKVWVRKEAALKATGHGLRISPNKVEVSGPEEEPELLSWPLDIPPAEVRFRRLSPGPGYVGAIAVIGGRSVQVVETHLSTARPAAVPAA